MIYSIITELNNYRPLAIINVICKLFMMVVREKIKECVEESGMLGDMQGGFRRGRRIEEVFYAREDDRDGKSKKGVLVCGFH